METQSPPIADVVSLDFAESSATPGTKLEAQRALAAAVQWARLDAPTYGWRRVLHRTTGINLGPSKHEATIRLMLVAIVDELENRQEHTP